MASSQTVFAKESTPELRFAVEDARPVEFAAIPTLCFSLRIERVGGGAIRSVMLNAQLRINATRRSYDEPTKRKLAELFGTAKDFGRAVRSFLWTQTAVVVPPFSDSTVVELHVPCTYDFEVIASKYLNAVPDGDVALEFLFSGTLFHSGENGQLQVAHISWDCEADYRLPVEVWKQTMDGHFPDAAWIRLGKESLDRLYDYRTRRCLLDWDTTVHTLLDEEG